jgi:hypothetical protein
VARERRKGKKDEAKNFFLKETVKKAGMYSAWVCV